MSFIVGNCIDVLKQESKRFDFVYMDPPYNTGRDWFNFDDRFETPKHYIENLIEPMLVEVKESEWAMVPTVLVKDSPLVQAKNLDLAQVEEMLEVLEPWKD